MKIYVDASAKRSGCGTCDYPFKRINDAAQQAQPGDEVLVAPGTYREYVNPKFAGTADARITYRSEVSGGAVITGAEPVKNWTLVEGDVYEARIPNGIFGGYNPYTTVVRGDWYFAPDPVHTGEVYLNGTAMYEVLNKEAVFAPQVYEASWERDKTLCQWYTEQDDGWTVILANFGGKNPNEEQVEINVRRNCFMPKEEGIGYITVAGFVLKQAATQWAPPTAYQDGLIGPHWSKGWIIEDCEISDSRCSGISLGKYLQPENDNKWTTRYTKDGTQTERDNIMQAQAEGWSKETVGSHIVRRCHIHDCGQTGIVGHLGGVFSIIEDNHIHHINNKQDLAGAEIGGIKMHAAIDVIIRRNRIDHCTRGLWLDWQAQGTRVTQNLFHDNMPPKGTWITPLLGLGEDIFVEVSHGPTLIDHNLLLSACSGRFSTQGLALVHNLIAGSFTFVGAGVDNGGVKLPTPRYTPYHMKHDTRVAGFMTILHGDARFYNNIFVQQPVSEEYIAYAKENDGYDRSHYQFTVGTKPYDGYPTGEEYFARFGPWKITDEGSKDKFYDHLPVYTGGNVYFNGAQPCDSERDAFVDEKDRVTLSLKEDENGVRLKTNLYDFLPKQALKTISSDILGQAFESEQRFENPDGSEIIFNVDYFDQPRAVTPCAGPFEGVEESQKDLF